MCKYIQDKLNLRFIGTLRQEIFSCIYTAKNNFLGKKKFLNLRNYFLKQENISCLKK